MQESVEPYSYLIEAALKHLRELDPTWDFFQPIGFRATVVERWKKAIRAELWGNTCMRWSLIIDNQEFFVHRPLFCRFNKLYNPYLKRHRKAT